MSTMDNTMPVRPQVPPHQALAHANLAVSEIGYALIDLGAALVDLGSVQANGAGNAEKRGSVAAGLRRAAWRVEHGTIAGFGAELMEPEKKPETKVEVKDGEVEPQEVLTGAEALARLK
jgi:hypothetical protein